MNTATEEISRVEKPAWPASAVELWLLADISPRSNNSRTHPEEQIRQIVASIREWGWTVPMLVDEDGTLIAGHGRLEAAQRLDLVKVPVMVARGWTEAQKRAYVIADNRLAENASWDLSILRSELSDLRDLEYELELTGFSLGDISGLLDRHDGKSDPDDIPDQPDPITQPGDLWHLGPHRLLCGDATNAEAVARLLDGVAPHLMVTDPPYGVNYEANWRDAGFGKSGDGSGGRAVGKVENDNNADWREAWALFPGDVAYIWHAGTKAHIVAESLQASGFEIRAQIVWAKNNIVVGRGHYHTKHEPCWYAVRNKGHWQGDRKQSTVWNIDKPMKSETGHSTQKPVECMRRPIVNNSSAGQAVYDPFLGSGTTLIACEMEARVCYGLELSPAYCDLIVRRWEEFTGKEATRES